MISLSNGYLAWYPPSKCILNDWKIKEKTTKETFRIQVLDEVDGMKPRD